MRERGSTRKKRQNYRSPDTRAQSRTPRVDVRSPDAREASRPQKATHPSIEDPKRKSVLPVETQLELRSRLPKVQEAGLATPVQSLLKQLDKLPHAQRTNIIAGFHRERIFDNERDRADLYSEAKRKGVTLPANATDEQILRALYEPKRSLVSDVAHNFLPDAVSTLAGIPAGTYGLGVAAGSAARGNTEPIKEIARQQYEFFRNPEESLREHPFQVATLASGALRTGGAVAGRLKGFEATPRRVTPAGEAEAVLDASGKPIPPPPVDRGLYSKNAAVRPFQKWSDQFAESVEGSPNTPFSGERVRAKASKKTRIREQQRSDMRVKENLEPVLEAASPLSRSEQMAVLGRQGNLPSELIQHFQGRLEKLDSAKPTEGNKLALWRQERRNAEQELDFWTKVHQKWGDGMPADQRRFREAAIKGSRGREQILSELKHEGKPYVSEETAARAAYIPQIRVQAEASGPSGNVHSAYLETEDDIARLESEMAKAPSNAELKRKNPELLGQTPTREVLSGQLEEAKREAAVLLETIRGRSGPLGTDEPPWVPNAPKRGIGQSPGKIGRKSTDARRALGIKATQHRTGEAYASGSYDRSPEAFFGSLAKPPAVASALNHFQKQIEQHATPLSGGEMVDLSKYDLINTTGTAPKQHALTKGQTGEPMASALDEITGEPLGVSADSLFTDITRNRPSHSNVSFTKVPDEGQWVAVPRVVVDQLENEFRPLAQQNPVIRTLMRGTHAWRWATLALRPAWLAANVGTDVIMPTVAGAGPKDWLRGKNIPKPPGVDDASFVATQLRSLGESGRKGNLDFGVKRGIKAAVRDPSIAYDPRVSLRLVGNLFREANVRFNNKARSATYAHFAMPEAERLAKEANTSVEEQLQAMANGDTPAAEAAAMRSVDKLNEFMGNWAEMGPSPALDLLVPFHRWIRFATKLSLVTLPVKYPGRALLLQRLGDLGIVGGQQQGFLPSYLTGAIPWGDDQLVGTQNVNPFATPLQFSGYDPSWNVDQANQEGVMSSVNPLLKLPLEWASGRDLSTFDELKGPDRKPVGPFDTKTGVNRALNLIPAYGAVKGRSGISATGEPYQRQSQMPKQSFEERMVAYLTGVNRRPVDFEYSNLMAIRALRDRLQGRR